MTDSTQFISGRTLRQDKEKSPLYLNITGASSWIQIFDSTKSRRNETIFLLHTPFILFT